MNPGSILCRDNALGPENRAQLSVLQFLQGLLNASLSELLRCLHAPAGKDLIGVVMVMLLAVAAALVVMVVLVVMAAALVVMMVLVVMAAAFVVMMMLVVTAAAFVVMVVLMAVAAAFMVMVMLLLLVLLGKALASIWASSSARVCLCSMASTSCAPVS